MFAAVSMATNLAKQPYLPKDITGSVPDCARMTEQLDDKSNRSIARSGLGVEMSPKEPGKKAAAEPSRISSFVNA